ncbi:MAG: AbrB/MazE/SpoVT family DNA-binding domain-containing protein [Blastomonas sp.]
MSIIETRTFKSGNSIAVRLPKALGIDAGTSVEIEQRGEEIIVRRTHDPVLQKRRLLKMLKQLKALPKPDHVEKPEAIEFPDRPGL